jgi:predicted deacylase
MADIARSSFHFDSPVLGELVLPYFEVTGRDGPTLALIAGVHGCEYSSIAAVRDVVRAVEAEELAGRVVAIPVVNWTAFAKRTPFVTPEDGKNLNRCFPGRADGTYSEALAHHVFGAVSAADYLIDLHGGDFVESLEPFVLYDESPVEETARAMAKAFGLQYAICSAREDRIEGTTVAAAADIGLPAIVAEAGGRGLLEDEARRALSNGVLNVMRSLEMLHSAPEQTGSTTVFRRFVWLYSQADGWWEPTLGVGDSVEAGAELGAVRSVLGEELERVVAPDSGVVLFMTSVPSVAEHGILMGIGAGGSPLA